jgi:FecR protein
MLRHSMRRWYLSGRLLRKSGLLLSMIFTLVFFLAPLSHAQDADDEDGHDSHARIVRISYVEGEVRLDNGHGYESATMNVPLTESNWLQTGSDGWAEVQLEDGSIIRLAPDTTIAFTELGRSSSGGTVTTVDLDQGEAEFKITKRDDSDFQVTVKKNTIVLAHSGSFRVTSTNADPMEVEVWKGEVGVRDGESGAEVAVKKNETFILDATDVSRYALDKGTEADGLDQWSKQRDDYLSTYAAAGQGYTQSPYQYGVSDLNQYGQFYDVPDYGSVWQPNGVSLGWDPFSNGYWAYSPGFGYTWVSSYPWGWMPFRYGRWVFVGGRGWCWAPGGWNRWNNRPRIANAPPGFRPPLPPADRRIVGGAPGKVTRPGTTVGGGGAGGRSSGPGGSRVGDRDGDNRNLGRPDGNRGNRRVLTNDDVQARVPRTDVPAQPQPPAVVDAERKPDHKPTIEQQEPAGAASGPGRDADRFRGDREPPREPVRRSNDAPAPPASQPVRQYNPPPQSYSPPNRQQERQSAPPPAPVHQPAPPPPPPAAAPAQQRQSSPPPESHPKQSDDGGRGRPPR